MACSSSPGRGCPPSPTIHLPAPNLGEGGGFGESYGVVFERVVIGGMSGGWEGDSIRIASCY